MTDRHTFTGDSCPACPSLDGCERKLQTVLLLDTETTGTDESAACIEVAASLYSVHAVGVLESYSSLIRRADNPAVEINRISEGLLQVAAWPSEVWTRVRQMAEPAQAIVAHGAEFDARFVPANVVGERPWICSLEDLQWPRAQKPRESLVKLALAHDLGVSHAHRAAVDVDLLGRLLSRVSEMGTDLGRFLARGLRPKATFRALVSYDDREQAKVAGFAWDSAARIWWRKMAVEDAGGLPFRVQKIGEGV